MNFAERIKQLRIERNMKQVDVARVAGIGADVYSTWESGRRQPHIKNLAGLCKAFKVDYNGLLGEFKSLNEVEEEIKSLKIEWEKEIKAIKGV